MSEKSATHHENSFVRLGRFLLGYGLAVATLLYALPVLAGQLEAIYESMSSVLRFGAVVLFATAVGGMHFLARRGRKRR